MFRNIYVFFVEDKHKSEFLLQLSRKILFKLIILVDCILMFKSNERFC